MTVLQEILKWAQSRPTWQQDALRRLVARTQLTNTDINDLAQLCKRPYDLHTAEIDGQPLTVRHLPAPANTAPAITLASLTHDGHVNALAPGQTLTFGPNLTIIYGDNGAGKSGYARILKHACRARASEDILDNVFANTIPGKPTATIHYRIGKQDPTYFPWTDTTDPDEHLGRISVFDTQTASVYVTDKTDVAYRPFCLDLFDRLVKACQQVRSILDRERTRVQIPKVLPELPKDTKAHTAIANLTLLTDTEHLKQLTTLSTQEDQRLGSLAEQLARLTAEDPMTTAKALRLKANRYTTLQAHLHTLSRTLNAAHGQAAQAAWTALQAAQTTAGAARATAFPPATLPETGTRVWRDLWEAARQFSQHAYPNTPFPVVHDTAQCLLCQQPLDNDARTRLQRFEAFTTSTAEQHLHDARNTLARARETITGIEINPDYIAAPLADVDADDQVLASKISRLLDAARHYQDAFRATTDGTYPTLPDLPIAEAITALQASTATFIRQADELQAAQDPKERAKLEQEHNELQARSLLRDHLPTVLDEVDRLKRQAAYEVCRKDTDTYAITAKSTEITTRVVTDTLVQTFAEELKRLHFDEIDVVLRPAGGKQGTTSVRLKVEQNQLVRVCR